MSDMTDWLSMIFIGWIFAFFAFGIAIGLGIAGVIYVVFCALL